jgi:hypothetical protein
MRSHRWALKSIEAVEIRRRKSKAPPGGQRGFESLAGFGLGDRDPANRSYKRARRVIVPENFFNVSPRPHPPHSTEALAVRQSLLTPPVNRRAA